MARIRTIKPSFFRHEALFEAEQETGLPLRVAFAGLWTASDREGRFQWLPRQLKLDCLPYDDIDFSRVLDALTTRGFVVKYASDGVDYGCIPSWNKHQVINNRETPSEIPAPPESPAMARPATREARVDDASATPLCNYQGEGKGREGEQEGNKSRPSVLSSADAKDAQPTKSTKVSQLDSIPYQQVIDAYNDACGESFPQASKLTDKRRKAIRARWAADTSNPDERKRTNSLDYWRRYFGFCASGIDFFRKAASGEHRGDHAGWRPDFDFLMTERTWLGVREGKYQ